MSGKALRISAVPLALTLCLSGCVLPPSTIPIATRPITPAGSAGSTLVVLLHGRGGAPEDFEKARFAEIADEDGVKTELLLVDAHEGYYKDRTILTRLREDIVGPARERGMKVWIVGVSMGGTGALLYARRYPGELAGVFAMAPFLGKRAEIREILDAGGIDSWSAGDKEEVFPWEAWSWLKTRPETREPGTPIYVAFGTSDRFARAVPLLAHLLPKERLSTTAGGHTWSAWGTLWDQFLRSGALKPQDNQTAAHPTTSRIAETIPIHG